MDEVIDISITSGASFGELNFMINAFLDAIGQPGFYEMDNPVPMRNDRFDKGLEGRNFSGIHPGAPLSPKKV